MELRDRLLSLREDLGGARREFRWPRFEEFNWAADYFDVIAADNANTALRVVDDRGADQSLSFAALARRSSQVASFLRRHGVGRGDRVLIMLGNVVPLWETMLA
jgi:acetyl-CoA synthetase